MQKPGDFRKLVEPEIGRPMAGVELRQAEVDSVGPIGDRRAQRFPIAGGSQQFGNRGGR